MSMSPKRLALLGLIVSGGCAGPSGMSHRLDADHQVAGVVSQVTLAQQGGARAIVDPQGKHASQKRLGGLFTNAIKDRPRPAAGGAVNNEVKLASQFDAKLPEPILRAASTSVAPASVFTEPANSAPKTVMIDGVTYALQPVDGKDGQSAAGTNQPAGYQVGQAGRAGADVARAGAVRPGAEYVSSATPVVIHGQAVGTVPQPAPMFEGSFELPVSPPIEEPVPLNLPSVLSAIDSRHPVVGQARWRVQQAYAQYDQAQALWLPSIQAGFSFHRHDGNYQASNGDIVDVNRNSFQYGLGAGATGAGTTNARPGLIAQFHVADAIFLPKVTERSAWAEGHAAAATLNVQMRDAASAYFDLVAAHQDLRIIEQSRERFAELAGITVDFAEAGEGLQADADRLRTELALMDGRLVRAEERVAVAAARLAQAISLDGSGTIVPTDVNAIPLDLTSPGADESSLVASALRSRPELKESQALVAAACEAYRREKYAPFVPSVLLGFSTGGFGGGRGNNMDNVEGRYDFDAVLSWEMRNLGFGEKAARRLRSAQVQQARFEKLRLMDQVARDVSESYSQVGFRRRQIDIAQAAIQNAEDSYSRNLERIRDGEGLPLEVLQSAEALESAQRAYMQAVMDYNQAQIRLQWALGFPVSN